MPDLEAKVRATGANKAKKLVEAAERSIGDKSGEAIRRELCQLMYEHELLKMQPNDESDSRFSTAYLKEQTEFVIRTESAIVVTVIFSGFFVISPIPFHRLAVLI